MARKQMVEDVVLAVLHKVSRDTRIAADQKLVAIFNGAAKSHPAIFGAFAMHPQYHDSRVLDEALQVLDLGGSIVRDNPAQKYFRVAPLTRGAYGKSKFQALNREGQEVVEEVASKITIAFTKSNNRTGRGTVCSGSSASKSGRMVRRGKQTS